MKTKTLRTILFAFFVFNLTFVRAQENVEPNPFTAQVGGVEKIGFKDSTGRIIVEPKFDERGFFAEGLLPVRIDQKWGFMNSAGKIVIDFKYNDIREFYDGLIAVNVGACCHGAKSFMMGGKWGYMDKTGKEVIPLKYDGATAFHAGLAPVKKLNPGESVARGLGKYALITKAGKEVTPFKYDDYYDFHEKEQLFQFTINGKFGYVDTKGKEPYGFKYKNAFSFYDGLAAVCIDSTWGYIDVSGNVAIALTYDEASAFREGLAAVRVNGKWGFIDKTNKLIIPSIYEHERFFYTFANGFTRVKLNGKYGMIDKSGKEIIPIVYDKIFPFDEKTQTTKALVGSNEYSIDLSGKKTLTKGTPTSSDLQEQFKAFDTEYLAYLKQNNLKQPANEVVTAYPYTNYYDAIKAGSLKSVYYLWKQKTDINAKYKAGEHFTLNDAIDFNQYEIAEFFLLNNFDIPLSKAERSVLHLFCISDKPEDEAMLKMTQKLIDKGADVNVLFNNLTPLHFAAMHNHVELARVLLNNKARTDIDSGFSDATVLQVAKKHKNKELVKLLKEYGAK